MYLHRDTYLGGSYGPRGGHDIALLKTYSKETLDGYQGVALPPPSGLRYLDKGLAFVYIEASS